ncbi:Fe/S biogenesis protein NfuA [Buchnera aphidicola (Tetraneura ulmi)]|uniref:NifU family protein n=1 Tax=Buchnera aphidicola TaxID=9 RepID=UPI003464405E
MIYISTKAQKYFRTLLLSESKGTQITVFIDNVGTVNAEGKVAFFTEKKNSNEDYRIFYYNGFMVYIKTIFLQYLKDSEIDLLEDRLETRLILKAPNIRNRNFGTNSLRLQIEEFIEKKINTELLSHGGKVSLVEISSDGVVKIQFLGGCNGCSMVSLTLKEGVEKKIILSFPEIKSVEDVTNHISGNHSYFS